MTDYHLNHKNLNLAKTKKQVIVHCLLGTSIYYLENLPLVAKKVKVDKSYTTN